MANRDFIGNYQKNDMLSKTDTSGFGAFLQSLSPALSAVGTAISPALGIGLNIGANALGSWFQNRVVNSSLTGKEREQNAWNAEQAQLNRDFQQQMSDTSYQRGVADMQAAGINPALAIGQGGASTPTGSNAQGSASVVNAGNAIELYTRLKELKIQKELADSEADRNRKEGDAALMNAATNVRNAGTNEMNAQSNARQAAVAEARVDIEYALSRSKINVDKATINDLAENAAYMKTLREYIPKNYDISKMNANAAQKQAFAAIRQADAAVQNAATNSWIADYQTDLMYSQTLLNEFLSGEHEELLKQLPEKLRLEIENMKKEGIKLDKQARWLNRQGNLASAQMVRTYVGVACDVANAVCNVAKTVTGSSGGFSPMMPQFGDDAYTAAGVIGAI